jgi:hypothetical protein
MAVIMKHLITRFFLATPFVRAPVYFWQRVKEVFDSALTTRHGFVNVLALVTFGIATTANAAQSTYRFQRDNGNTYGGITTDWSEACDTDPSEDTFKTTTMTGTALACTDIRQKNENNSVQDMVMLINPTSYASATDITGVNTQWQIEEKDDVNVTMRFSLGYVTSGSFTSFGNGETIVNGNSLYETIDLSGVSGTAPAGSHLALKVTKQVGNGEIRLYIGTDADGTGNDSGLLAIDESSVGGPPISGTIYTDEGVTTIADGTTVRLIINGTSVGTDTTTSGAYSISTTSLSAGDAILIYIDDDNGTTNDATTVTVSDGAALSGLDAYVDHLITRHDNGGVLSNALMDTAKGAYSDTEILYTLDGSDNLTAETGTEIYIPTSHTYTPGAGVTTQGTGGDVDVRGTLNGGANTFAVFGNWDSSVGTFNYDTSTIDLVDDGNLKMKSPTWQVTAYNLKAAKVGKTTTLQSLIGVANLLTLDTGTITGAQDLGLFANSGEPLVDAGATISVNTLYWRPSNGTVTVSGGSNYDCIFWFWPSGSNAVLNFGGPITLTGQLGVYGDAGQSGIIFDTKNFALTAASLQFGTGGFDGSTSFNFGSSTVDFNGEVLMGINGGNHTLNLQSASLSVAGNWSMTNGTGTGTVIPGTSTVILDGTIQTITGDSTFNNLTKSVVAAETLIFAASSTTTINGTATLNGTSGNLLTLASGTPGTHWNFNVAAGASKAIDYVDVSWSDASGSDATQKPINPTNFTDGGNTIDWFGAPDILIVKASTTYSDPVNNLSNPKAIPGAVEYSEGAKGVKGNKCVNLENNTQETRFCGAKKQCLSLNCVLVGKV